MYTEPSARDDSCIVLLLCVFVLLRERGMLMSDPITLQRGGLKACNSEKCQERTTGNREGGLESVCGLWMYNPVRDYRFVVAVMATLSTMYYFKQY